MRYKRCFHYFRLGDLAGLESFLDAMSRGGWQAERPGRFVQRFVQGEGVFLHRIGACRHRPGSADEIAFLAAQERAGWSVAARRGPWILFRKPVPPQAEEDRGEPDPPQAEREGPDKLDGHRDSVRELFARRITRLESLRRWMLVLGALLLIGGYASALLPVLYATVLPMSVALYATYRIKWMEALR